MTRTKLEQQYNDFWLQYSNVLPENVRVYPLRSNPFKVTQREQGNEFEVVLAIDFKSPRYRSSSSKKEIAVRIKAEKRCVFDGENSKITKSNVLVNFFEIDNLDMKLTLLESLHYDYESDTTSLLNHPIFHCQSCKDTINGDFFERKFEILNDRKYIHQQLRIPTANMDMISVLLSIAADLFTKDEFKKVLDVYDKKQWHEKLPHVSHHEGFFPGKCFRSRAWYIVNKT